MSDLGEILDFNVLVRKIMCAHSPSIDPFTVSY